MSLSVLLVLLLLAGAFAVSALAHLAAQWATQDRSSADSGVMSD